MEIPFIVISRFQFQNPSFLLYLKALSTLAALLIAAVAAFSTLIRRSKRLLRRIRSAKSIITPLSSPSSLSTYLSSDSDTDSDDDEDESSSDDASDDVSEDDVSEIDFEEIRWQNGDFQWPDEDLAREGSVVKFWNSDENPKSFSWSFVEIPTVHVAPDGKWVTVAGKESKEKGGVRVWDGRVAGATWQGERVVGVGGEGRGWVCVGDDVSKLTVVDLRNGGSTSKGGGVRLWNDGAVTVLTGCDGLISSLRRNRQCARVCGEGKRRVCPCEYCQCFI